MPESTTSTHDDALLDALRCNLRLLQELTLRNGVATRPDPADDRRPVINGPDDVQRLLGPEMAGLAQEQVRVLLLDTAHRLVGQRVIYQGNVRAVLVRPAEVLRPAVAAAIPRLIVCHNHPSGDPMPSAEDRTLTRALVGAADLLGIQLLDHVIIGGARAFSMQEHGLMPWPMVPVRSRCHSAPRLRGFGWCLSPLQIADGEPSAHRRCPRTVRPCSIAGSVISRPTCARDGLRLRMRRRVGLRTMARSMAREMLRMANPIDANITAEPRSSTEPDRDAPTFRFRLELLTFRFAELLARPPIPRHFQSSSWGDGFFVSPSPGSSGDCSMPTPPWDSPTVSWSFPRGPSPGSSSDCPVPRAPGLPRPCHDRSRGGPSPGSSGHCRLHRAPGLPRPCRDRSRWIQALEVPATPPCRHPLAVPSRSGVMPQGPRTHRSGASATPQLAAAASRTLPGPVSFRPAPRQRRRQAWRRRGDPDLVARVRVGARQLPVLRRLDTHRLLTSAHVHTRALEMATRRRCDVCLQRRHPRGSVVRAELLHGRPGGWAP